LRIDGLHALSLSGGTHARNNSLLADTLFYRNTAQQRLFACDAAMDIFTGCGCVKRKNVRVN
jgi:hypothetical protein